MEILKMGQPEFLDLTVEDIRRFLTPDEIAHIAKTLGAFWAYDYQAAKQGRVGMHAILKSGFHSDGFFISQILLAWENIRRIISAQIAMRLYNIGVPKPDYVAGVPTGATELGKDIAGIFGVKNAKMTKVGGQIFLVTLIEPGQSLLFIEDVCTRGTGFTESVRVAMLAQPRARILPYDPVIINRGGLKQVVVEGVGEFMVLPVVEWRVQDWDPATCPLCINGSTPIKPKATDENWRAITTSQL